jgi:hypothetical protein
VIQAARLSLFGRLSGYFTPGIGDDDLVGSSEPADEFYPGIWTKYAPPRQILAEKYGR